MPDKVKTAIFGKDLRVQLKKYPLSKAGDKIDIVNTGEGYFMPELGPTNFLYWPTRKRFLLFGKQSFEPIHFCVRRGSKCIDFGIDPAILYGPDIEQLKKANLNFLAQKVGVDTNKGTPWYIWPILIFSLLTFFLMLAQSGVIR